MKIAVARYRDHLDNAHFGYADHFEIFEVAQEVARSAQGSAPVAVLVESRTNTPHCGDDGGDQDLLGSAAGVVGDCAAVVARKIGPCARDALLGRNIIAVEHEGPGLAGAEDYLRAIADYLAGDEEPGRVPAPVPGAPH